jgi:hypothetical protein
MVGTRVLPEKEGGPDILRMIIEESSMNRVRLRVWLLLKEYTGFLPVQQ